MIGILIGLIVVLVVFNLLSASENYKRMAIGASDAQINGLLSHFTLSREVGNGGNGISLSANELAKCSVASGWRPVPVLVHDSGSDDVSDNFITLYSSSPHVVWPVVFTSDVVAAAAPLIVQSPNGFSAPTPAATNYRVVAVNPTTGDCEMATIVGATPPDVLGRVTLTQGVPATSQAYSSLDGVIVNLGPVGQAVRTQYEVRDSSQNAACDNTLAAAVPCQLFMRDLLTAGQWNPIAGNVVLMKVQYGIDLTPTIDGRVDCWTVADNKNDCGAGAGLTDFRDVTVPTFPQVNLQRIVAVRIGLVVRDDEPDLKAAPNDLSYVGTRAQMYLFNCSTNTDAGCPRRIHLSNAVIRNGWRYRTYELVVPLRNAIYNDLP
jgi:type IV pilus assembly protein PilW